MYNSKKWSYTCIARKNWSYTCITRKNMEWYIPIHSYTFHLFRRFWGKGFWKSIVCLAFVWPKKCGAMGRDCWNQKCYNLGFKFWQVRHDGPQWFKSKGMHVPQNHTFFWARQADWKVPQVTLLLMLSNHGPVLPQPQRLIEPLLYKLGPVITVLKDCLAAS